MESAKYKKRLELYGQAIGEHCEKYKMPLWASLSELDSLHIGRRYRDLCQEAGLSIY